MLYKDKYLKYKFKYQQLKKQLGGRDVDVYNYSDSKEMFKIDVDQGDDLYTLKQQVLSYLESTGVSGITEDDLEFYTYDVKYKCKIPKINAINDSVTGICVNIKKSINASDLIPKRISSGFRFNYFK